MSAEQEDTGIFVVRNYFNNPVEDLSLARWSPEEIESFNELEEVATRIGMDVAIYSKLRDAQVMYPAAKLLKQYTRRSIHNSAPGHLVNVTKFSVVAYDVPGNVHTPDDFLRIQMNDDYFLRIVGAEIIKPSNPAVDGTMSAEVFSAVVLADKEHEEPRYEQTILSKVWQQEACESTYAYSKRVGKAVRERVEGSFTLVMSAKNFTDYEMERVRRGVLSVDIFDEAKLDYLNMMQDRIGK
jgi:hypothetical protein